jgi:hypothetical protein
MIGRPSKAGKRTQLEIGLFGCQKCKKPFREVTEQEDYFDIARWGHIALRQKGSWAC